MQMNTEHYDQRIQNVNAFASYKDFPVDDYIDCNCIHPDGFDFDYPV